MALLFLKVPWYSCHKDFITGSFLLRNPQWCYWPSSLLLLSSPTRSCLVHLSFLLFLPYSLHLVQLTKEVCPLLTFASDPLKNASECIMLNQRACFPVLLPLAWCWPVWAELCLPPVPMLRSLSSAPQKVTAEPHISWFCICGFNQSCFKIIQKRKNSRKFPETKFEFSPLATIYRAFTLC